MEPYVFQILSFIIGAGLVGLVAYLVNSVKSEIREIKIMLQGLVTKEVCEAYREKMNTDINNLGNMIRGR